VHDRVSGLAHHNIFMEHILPLLNIACAALFTLRVCALLRASHQVSAAAREQWRLYRRALLFAAQWFDGSSAVRIDIERARWRFLYLGVRGRIVVFLSCARKASWGITHILRASSLYPRFLYARRRVGRLLSRSHILNHHRQVAYSLSTRSWYERLVDDM